MAHETTPDEGSGTQSLTDWAQERPGWQQEALRRLSVQKELSSQDIDEIVELCRLSRNLPPKLPRRPKTRPLETMQFSPSQAEGQLFLRRLHGLKAVSALPNNASLQFVENYVKAGPCLAVVYGRNASGKSSYARILKACGRSRATVKPLPPNYLGKDRQTNECPEATIDFLSAESSHSAQWVQGDATDDRLQALVFFDAECADLQVTKPSTLGYMPGELHLLKTLGEVCRQVQEKLKDEQDSLVAGRAESITSPKLLTGTQARRALDGMKNAEDLEELRTRATLSEDAQNTLKELRVTFADVEKAGREAIAAYNRVNGLHNYLEGLAEAVSDERADALKQALANHKLAEEVLQSLPSREPADLPLAGFGTPRWRALWDAAKHYSEVHAYRGREFPETDDGSHCVLCQQELSRVARDRFREFARFFRQEVETGFASSKATVQTHIERLVRLDERRRLILLESLFSDLEQIAPELVQSVRAFWDTTVDRLTLLIDSSTEPKWSELPPLPVSPASQIKQLVQALLEKERNLRNTETRESLQQQLAELEAWAELRELLPDLEKDLEFRIQLDALEECAKDAGTDPITRQSTELAKILITDRLRRDFQDELKNLRLSTARVELAAHGRYGTPQFEIRLAGHPDGAAVPTVLSEGEKRCVALAGFFAELRGDSTVSALVFDDPVTSLDHNWRDAVAARLVQAASRHQVIVFTHDVVFLVHLQELAKKEGVPFHPTQVERLGTTVGNHKKGKPWIARSVGERLKLLKNTTLREARKLHDDEASSQSDYEEKVGYFYARLRETWERSVEECLFQESVVRFRRDISTQRLARLRQIEPEDIRIIGDAMTRCSLHMVGHDAVPQENLPAPPPDDLKADWSRLDDWVNQHRTRPELRTLDQTLSNT